MKLIELELYEWESIPIKFSGDCVLIEIVSNKSIDFGVLDDNNWELFDKDKKSEKIEWFENTTGPKEFIVKRRNDTKLWLIVWSINESGKACVCYRFSQPIE